MALKLNGKSTSIKTLRIETRSRSMVSKFNQIHGQAARAGKLEEEDFKKNHFVFLSAITDVENAPDYPNSTDCKSFGDDLFGDIVKAIGIKRKEYVKQGLLKPNPKKEKAGSEEVVDEIENLESKEVVDLEESRESAQSDLKKWV